MVLCQQGIQYFPDLDAALTEAARVTRTGGRLAVTTWTPPADRIPYFAAQLKAVTEHGDPEARARFETSLSCPADRLVAALTAAGFHDITIREVAFGIAFPDIADFVTGHLAAVPWGQSIEEAGEPASLHRGSGNDPRGTGLPHRPPTARQPSRSPRPWPQRPADRPCLLLRRRRPPASAEAPPCATTRLRRASDG